MTNAGKQLNLADGAVLRQSLERLVKTPLFSEKLGAGIRFGSCWERPLQYDWAFVLEQELHMRGHPKLVTVCEQQRVDIGIRELDDARLRYAIELKVWGNWWVTKQEIDKFQDDITKVDQYVQPAAAVAVCVFASPHESSKNVYSWMRDKAQKPGLVQNLARLHELLKEHDVGCEPITPVPLRMDFAHLNKLELWAGAYFNNAAEAELRKIEKANS